MTNKVLYVFDMDDTLLSTPKFVGFVDVVNGQIEAADERIKEYVNDIKGIYSTLFFKEICFKKSNDFIIVTDCQTKRPIGSKQIDFIQDLTPEQLKSAGLKQSTKKKLLRAFGEQNGILVLNEFPGFYEKKETIGNVINESIYNIYINVENKMIVTGRGEKMREDVEKNMENLGMQMPNYGLHLFPGGGKSISEYKIKVIEDSIIANGWEEVHFFDDRLDWLTKASDEITTMFPNIKFYKHFVNNIKSKLSL